MRFYEQLLFHLMKKDGLRYDSDDEENEGDDEKNKGDDNDEKIGGEKAERTYEIEQQYLEDDLIEVSDIHDDKDKREFFKK